MRLFFAILFHQETCSKLLALRDELWGHAEHGNFSAPENLHLTLSFIGECNGKQVHAAKAALSEITFAPFAVSIDRIGKFRRSGGDIWWAGLRKNEPLKSLQSDLTDRLLSKGFALKPGDYSPHITLGREVVTAQKPCDIEPFGESVNQITLMKSERIRGKLTYTAVMRSGEQKENH